MDLGGTIPACMLDQPGKLSKIGLTSNNLTGTIPDVIPSNTTLFNFVADNNQLTGTVPASIVNARQLYQLSADSNQLNGSLPADFGTDMPLLTQVQLYDNVLTGELLVNSMAACCSVFRSGRNITAAALSM